MAVDITNCDREPIHIPGLIQPHGVLLSLSEPDLVVAQASDNTPAVFGRSVAHVLGQPLSAVLEAESFERVRRAAAREPLAEVNPLPLAAGGRACDGVLHRHAGALILEIEPRVEAPDAHERTHHPLRRAVAQLQSATTLRALHEAAVKAVQGLTRFERVMIYRFDEDDHGTVEAEAKSDLLDSYLGLHYPASDIPRQARELYLRNGIRIIPDARYTPAALVPALRPDTGAPLDLSFAVLRSVSPIHLEYLANMGVRGSMSVSLVVRGRLWGLVSCINHSAARPVPFEVRSDCELLGTHPVAADHGVRRPRNRVGPRAPPAGARAPRPGHARRPTTRSPGCSRIRRSSSGSWESTARRSWTRKSVPPDARPRRRRSARSPTGSSRRATASSSPHALSRNAPAFADIKDERERHPQLRAARRAAAALHRVPARDPADGRLGRRSAESPCSRMPAMRLHPRRSFALWREEVRLRSRPWTRERARGRRGAAPRGGGSRPRQAGAARAARSAGARRPGRRRVARPEEPARRDPDAGRRCCASSPARRAGDPASHLGASIDRTQRAVDRMNALIHDLLDLAKIEAGRFALERQAEPVDDDGRGSAGACCGPSRRRRSSPCAKRSTRDCGSWPTASASSRCSRTSSATPSSSRPRAAAFTCAPSASGGQALLRRHRHRARRRARGHAATLRPLLAGAEEAQRRLGPGPLHRQGHRRGARRPDLGRARRRRRRGVQVYAAPCGSCLDK